MRLVSLELLPEGVTGWASGVLVFGDHITQLFGPNGAGKTPVTQSIAYALGWPVSYREDIKEHCNSVRLRVLVGGRELTIKRFFNGPFAVKVSEQDQDLKVFYNEQEYSRFLFDLWGLQDPVVTQASGGSSRLYISHVLPIFFLDQDHGYSNVYYPASKFIKDQYAEVMRALFGISPKNPFDQRRIKASLKEGLERLDAAISRREVLISELTSEIAKPRRSEGDIELDLSQTMGSFEALRIGGNARDESELALDGEIRTLKQRASLLANEKADLAARIRSFSAIRHEIEVEADTLSLNEEARRVFSSFSSICANQACGLFLRSSESYGKSLLYLRDQIKDLDRSQEVHQERIRKIDESLCKISVEVEEKMKAKSSLVESSEAASLVDATARLTEKLIQLKKDLQIERQLSQEESAYVDDLSARGRTLDQMAGLSKASGQADLELLRTRGTLEERLAHWLGVLHAVNMPKQIEIDTDFDLDLGRDSLRAFKGSTLTRIVLAIRTATFEALLKKSSFSPRFLILDTPRQQDIDKKDFANYIGALKDLAKKHNAQIVFSSSNYQYSAQKGDEEWKPQFPGEEQDMYLGQIQASDPEVSSG
jgi:hypothetical protein